MGIFWGVGVPAPNAQEQEHQIVYDWLLINAIPKITPRTTTIHIKNTSIII